MNTDKVMALWSQSFDDEEGIRQGYTAQQLFFAALLQREMEADGWRQCAEAQRDDVVTVPISTLVLLRSAITDDAPFSNRAIAVYEELKLARRAAIDEARSANDT